MKKHLLDVCIGGALMGSVVFNVVLGLGMGSSAADVRVGRTAPSTDSRAPVWANCNKHFKAETEGDEGDDGGEQRRDGFAREPRDSKWATSHENVLEAHLQELLSPYNIELAVECRTRCCEFSGDNVDWALVASEIQSSAGLLGWATEISFSDHVVACFDQKAAHAPPTDLVRRRNDILARLSRETEKCGELSPVATVLAIRLAINIDGSIQSSTRDGELSGSEAALCIEKRLLEGARFDPRREPALVQFVFALTPGDSESQ